MRCTFLLFASAVALMEAPGGIITRPLATRAPSPLALAKRGANNRKVAKQPARGFSAKQQPARGFSASKPASAGTKPSSVSLGEARRVDVDLGRGASVVTMVPELQDPESVDEAAHLYGAGDIVWPASVALARLVRHCPSFVQGLSVLEVGCGLGASGLAAGLAGAAHVCSTDVDTEVLALVKQASIENDIMDVLTVQELNWSEAATAESAESVIALASGPFDVILGADVLYDQTLTDRLGDVLELVLNDPRQSPNAEREARRCLLADPPQRNHRHRLQRRGLDVTEMPLPGPEGMVLVTVVAAD